MRFVSAHSGTDVTKDVISTAGRMQRMACSYIMATDKDLDLLVQMRMAFVEDLHPEYDENQLLQIRTGTEAYVREQLAAGSYIGFFGVDHDVCGMMPITTMASVPVDAIACTGAPLYRKVGYHEVEDAMSLELT